MSLRRISTPFAPQCLGLILIMLLVACSVPTGGITPAPTTSEAVAPPISTEEVPEAVSTPAVATDTRAPEDTPTAAVPPTVKPPSTRTTEPVEIEASPTGPVSPQLAFLKNGDIWLLDSPESQPYQLTLAGDILSYAWSPNGDRLAAFNGRSLCFFQSDGSIRTACLELGLTDEQAEVERRIVWSPDGRWIVLWNPVNPQDDGSIGWLMLALDTADAMWRVQDPVDWGAELAPNNEPGGFTGQPLFLADGRLVGTLSHRYLCGQGGCRYQLFSFDLSSLTPSFLPFPNNPEDGWSEGRNLILSPDGSILTNYGAFLYNCDSANTFIDRFNLSTENRQTYTLEGRAVSSLAISPDEISSVLAQTANCSTPGEQSWSQTCGLSQGMEVLSMLRWDPQTGEIQELSPGISPVWSPDGDWVSFNSCLTESASGAWSADAETPASIYLFNNDGTIRLISEGTMPSWRPR